MNNDNLNQNNTVLGNVESLDAPNNSQTPNNSVLLNNKTIN